MHRYPQSRLIVLDAYSMQLTAGLTVASVVVIGVDLLCMEAFDLDLSIANLRVSFIALGVSLLALLSRMGLALAHKCPACGKHPTIQGFVELHPSVANGGDNAWAKVVRDVLQRRTFTCFHCGTSYAVSDAA
jgi:hypothetical protein